MCDYSLHHVASRPAKVGDRLVSTRFMGSTTGGFAAVGDPNVAVCLRPGTEIAFDQEVSYERGLGLILPKLGYTAIRQRVARFRQVDLDRPHAHHDALEFTDGEIVLVTILREGQTATVLQLPADAGHEHAGHEPQEHRHDRERPAEADLATTDLAARWRQTFVA
jgi:hypothetical protein